MVLKVWRGGTHVKYKEMVAFKLRASTASRISADDFPLAYITRHCPNRGDDGVVAHMENSLLAERRRNGYVIRTRHLVLDTVHRLEETIGRHESRGIEKSLWI